MNLNPEQKMAVKHLTGPCILTATPGSGKTLVVTARLVNLIKNCNVDPSNILCLTFTNKAANEMRSRAAKAVGELSSKVWISTFHSLCLAILRRYGEHVKLFKGFSVYSEKDQLDLLTKIARMHEYECKPSHIKEIARITNGFREDIEDFESCAEKLCVVEKGIVKEYLDTLDNFNAVDFSGILYKVWFLFQKEPASAEKLHEKFQYLMVDEMQDTNVIQYDIIKKIADPSGSRLGNLFAVGDANQAIFEWRSARPENIGYISKDFDSVNNVTLPRNYRSTTEILAAAERLINYNDDTEPVSLISENGSGCPVAITAHPMPEDESSNVVATIRHLKRKYNYKWQDFAILYRTNALSKVPEMKLRGENIPYKIVGGFSFFDRREIKTALSYMSFFSNPQDTMSFARAISTPRRGVGDIMIGRLERKCQQEKISILEACKRCDEIDGMTSLAKKSLQAFAAVFEACQQQEKTSPAIVEVVSRLLSDTGYYDHIQEESTTDSTSAKRIENLDELLAGIADYQNRRPGATVDQYIQSIQLLTDFGEKEEDAVNLLTIHSAKGLEFSVVFIIGVEERIMPHVWCQDNINEERRLMYVGISRAMHILSINYCSRRQKYSFAKNQKTKWGNNWEKRVPSRFIAEIEG